MTRQEQRRLLRELDKTIKKAEKTKEFQTTKKYFASLSEEDYERLKQGNGEEKEVKLFTRFWENLRWLQAKVMERESLLVGRVVHEENA